MKSVTAKTLLTVFIVPVALLATVTLASCKKTLAQTLNVSHENETLSPSFARISLGNPKRSDLRNWSGKTLGTVEFTHGSHHFVIDNVYGLAGAEDP